MKTINHLFGYFLLMETREVLVETAGMAGQARTEIPAIKQHNTQELNYSQVIKEHKATFMKYLTKIRGYAPEDAELILDMCQIMNVNPAAVTITSSSDGSMSVAISYQYLLSKVIESGVVEYLEININRDTNGSIKDGECIIKRRDMSKEFKISLKFSEVNKNTRVWQKEGASMFRKTLILNAIKIACADIIERYSIFNAVGGRKEYSPSSYTQNQNSYASQQKPKQQTSNYNNKSETPESNVYANKIKELKDWYPDEETYKKIGNIAKNYAQSLNLSSYSDITKTIYEIMYAAYKAASSGAIEYSDIINGTITVEDLLAPDGA